MSNQKTALVTGANKGIGYEICHQLGALGWKVFLATRNEARGQKAVTRLQGMGMDAELVIMDVSDPESILKASERVKQHTQHLNVLVNNAAILLDENKAFLTLPTKDSLSTLQTNTLGPLWVTQTFLPLLKKGSRIVMVSSGAGEFCKGVSSYAPMYSLSKTALNALILHLHRELQGKDILINAMCPGWVRTDMGGSGASRSVEQGAETAIWLATEAPHNISGKFLRDKKEISW